MRRDRRDFLTRAVPGALLPLVAPWPGAAGARSEDAAAPRPLRAAPARVQIAPPDYPATEVLAYDGQLPGPLLRAAQGSALALRFENRLDQPSTIHWHGLRLPNAMDGVPGMTQPAVAPGGDFDYRFTLRDAGTFWYHPHSHSMEQVGRGLAGVLVVDEAAPPPLDGDHVLVLRDWRLDRQAQIVADFDNRHDLSHAGRLGNYVTVNGAPEARLAARPGARLRLRLVNTATARVFQLRLSGLRAWIAALDGMPLAAPEPAASLLLAPAQRADLIVDVTAAAGEEALIGSVERGGTFATVLIAVAGAALPARPDPAPLPQNDLPAIDPGAARTVPLVMEGGAMRGLPEGATWQAEGWTCGRWPISASSGPSTGVPASARPWPRRPRAKPCASRWKTAPPSIMPCICMATISAPIRATGGWGPGATRCCCRPARRATSSSSPKPRATGCCIATCWAMPRPA